MNFDGLRAGNVSLPGESFTTSVNFGVLGGGTIGFPAVSACYVHVTETTEPIPAAVTRRPYPVAPAWKISLAKTGIKIAY